MRTFITLTLLVIPSVSLAQTPEDERRATLIREAATARDANDHTAALGFARDASAIRMTPSLRLFIAEEELATGEHARAYDDATACVSDLAAGTSSPRDASLRTSCEALSQRLLQQVGFVVLTVPAVDGVRVQVGGAEIPQRQWRRVTVRAGTAVLAADAPGRQSFRRDVSVTAGASTQITIALPPRGDVDAVPRDPSVPAEGTPRPGAGAGPWVIMGIGAASLVAAGVFFGMREGEISSRDALCESRTGDCVTSNMDIALRAQSHQANAVTYSTVTTVTLSVGGAMVAGGLLWWLLGRGTSTESSARTSLIVAPTASGGVLGIRGSL